MYMEDHQCQQVDCAHGEEAGYCVASCYDASGGQLHIINIAAARMHEWPEPAGWSVKLVSSALLGLNGQTSVHLTLHVRGVVDLEV